MIHLEMGRVYHCQIVLTLSSSKLPNLSQSGVGERIASQSGCSKKIPTWLFKGNWLFRVDEESQIGAKLREGARNATMLPDPCLCSSLWCGRYQGLAICTFVVCGARQDCQGETGSCQCNLSHKGQVVLKRGPWVSFCPIQCFLASLEQT